MSNKKILILGSGPTGLITAWKLLEKGFKVTILEKNTTAGGLCRSWKENEFILDTGPHIFHTPDKLLKKFWKENFGKSLLEGKFYCKNVKGKKFNEFYDYPFSKEALNNFNYKLRKKIKSELKKCKKNNKRTKAKNFSEYIDGLIGPTLRKMFYEKYPEKIWGISTKKMTPDWAPNRIKFRDKILPFYHEEYAAVGKYGTGCIYDIIKKKIIDLGGTFKFNEAVIEIKSKNKEITEIITSKKNYKILNNKIVISSLPLNLTAKFMGKENKLKFRGICSVYLFYEQKYILPKKIHWLYFDSEKILFNRVSENKKLSKFVAPKNKSFLTAEITYSPGDKFSQRNKADIIDQVIKDLNKTKIVDNSKLIGTSINFEPYVYPVQFTDYKNEIFEIKSFVGSFNNLFSIGASGEFNYADSQILFHKSFDLVNSLTGKYNYFTNETKNLNRIDFNKSFKIGNNIVGNNKKAFIVAEAGLNHNGSFEIAKRLINNAKKAGCNSIKFQSFLPNSRVSKNVKTEKYYEKIIGTQESIYQLFNRLSINFKTLKKIFLYARKKKILIFSTPFDFKNVDYLEELNVQAYKIASSDLVNLPLIEYVAKKNKPLIISTGMSKISEIDEAVETVRSTGNKNLSLLHCNSSYPSNYEEVNLEFMKSLKQLYKIPVGFSDHTVDLMSSKTAILMGADIIERHFTLDKHMEGPDHFLSSNLDEMTELVNFNQNFKNSKKYFSKLNKDELNKTKLILGNGIKKIQPNEYITINSQKKCLYAKKNIKKGEVFSHKNLTIRGPAGGLMPKYYNILIDRKVKRNILEDYPINWEDI